MLLIKSTPPLLLRAPTASTVLFCSTTIERVLYSIVNAGFLLENEERTFSALGMFSKNAHVN